MEVSRFIAEIDNRNKLPRKDKLKMREDFQNALIYYGSIGVAAQEALSRLDLDNLGDFYVRPPTQWYPLDDAAKIYPISLTHGKMAMFRLSVYFKSAVIPELLQIALTFTIKRFPTFATTVKKGFFWHYLDTSRRRYGVQPEKDIPCCPLNVSRSSSQSFRVLYFRNRASVEYFHVLTDGSGAMVFLKTLTAEYLRLLGAKAEAADPEVLNINDVPSEGEAANEFARADKTLGASGFIGKPAVQMSGKHAKIKPCRILHFKMDAQQLKKAAKAKNTSITTYILALFFVAGKRATDEQEGDASIQIPVNMRKYYPSETLRNFSMFFGVRLPLSDIVDVSSIIPDITLQLEQKSTKENMSEMLNSTVRMVRSLRYIPLFIKTPLARIAHAFIADRIFTNNLSNLGVISMPPGLAEHIDSMDSVPGAALTNRASCSMVTFGNTVTLSLSKCTADPTFEESLFALLEADGVTPKVEGSELF